MALTEQQITELRTSLKRCRPETIEAAIRFRKEGAVEEIPTIVYGIIERHLAPEVVQRENLRSAPDSTRLIEDLGVDSLTLLEIILSIEETVGINIENEELKEVRTIGEVKQFIAKKVSVAETNSTAPISTAKRYTREEITGILPQQPPFLFLDEAKIERDVVYAKYLVRGDEQFLEGHFRGNPIFPASIVFEACGQAACLWLLTNSSSENANQVFQMEVGSPKEIEIGGNEVLFASMGSAHFYKRARPGDLLEFEVKLHRLRVPLAIFDGKVTVDGQRVGQVERLTLAFGATVMENLEAYEAANQIGSGDKPLKGSGSKVPGNPLGQSGEKKKKFAASSNGLAEKEFSAT